MFQSLKDIGVADINLSSKHEAEIWCHLRAGDKKALSFFYTKYFDTLYNYGRKITKDCGLTEDSIQDLFMELWNTKERLGEVSNVKYYLFKALRRKIIYKLSLLSRLPASDIDSFEIELSHKSHYLSEQINHDIREKMAQMVNTLSAKQKESIFLIYYEELSYEEAALIMELKVKTVYNLIHLAISKLRHHKEKLSLPSFLFLF
jgi:RNA polymerase sigma factor (sigma-70 family)